MKSHRDERLTEVLGEAQQQGFLGPGPVSQHIDHAERFMRAVANNAPGTLLDLGSGGGVPGLVLATEWPTSTVILLDANRRRTEFLQEAVKLLFSAGRVSVVRGRAEDVARSQDWREVFDLVVARSFGPPAVVAECAAGFIRVGGMLVVSEPPDTAGERWNGDGLATLGMSAVRIDGGTAVISQMEACPTRFPRRVGIPSKRPLF